MLIKKQPYGFSVSLKRGVDYRTDEDLTSLIKAKGIKYLVRENDSTWSRLLLFFNPDGSLQRAERVSARVFHVGT